MTRVGIARRIGWFQMAFSIILAVTIAITYAVYRSSLADYSRALAASILSVSDVLTITAEKMTARQDLLNDVQEALKISSNLLVALKTSVEAQGKKLPQYSADLKKAADVTGKLGNTLTDLGDKLLVLKIPTRIGLHPPQIVWTMPFDAQGTALKAQGRTINELSGNLTGIADSLVTDVLKLTSALIGLSPKALELLSDMENVTSKLGPRILPQAIESLKATSRNLRQAGDLVNNAEHMGFVLFLMGLFFAFVLALNSVAILLLAPQPANR